MIMDEAPYDEGPEAEYSSSFTPSASESQSSAPQPSFVIFEPGAELLPPAQAKKKKSREIVDDWEVEKTLKGYP